MTVSIEVWYGIPLHITKSDFGTNRWFHEDLEPIKGVTWRTSIAYQNIRLMQDHRCMLIVGDGREETDDGYNISLAHCSTISCITNVFRKEGPPVRLGAITNFQHHEDLAMVRSDLDKALESLKFNNEMMVLIKGDRIEYDPGWYITWECSDF